MKAQPAAAPAFGTGADPAEPRPTDTHSRAADARTHTAEQQQRREEEEDDEEDEEEQLTTMDTVLGADAETGTPPPGMTPPPLVAEIRHTVSDTWCRVQQKVLLSRGPSHLFMRAISFPSLPLCTRASLQSLTFHLVSKRRVLEYTWKVLYVFKRALQLDVRGKWHRLNLWLPVTQPSGQEPAESASKSGSKLGR